MMKLFILVSATVHILYITFLVVNNLLVEGNVFKWHRLVKKDPILYFLSILFCVFIAIVYHSHHGASILIASLPIVVLYMGSFDTPGEVIKRKRQDDQDDT